MPNEVLGIYFNVVGVLYTLILAFVVVTVWQDYDEMVVAIESEAHQLQDIREAAEKIPAPYNELIEHATVDYASAVRLDEWAKMADGDVSEVAEEKLKVLLNLREDLKQDKTGLEAVTDVKLYIKQLREIRHQRLMHLHTKVPNVLWVVLIAGCVVCIFFSFLIHVRNMRWQMILTTVLTSVLAMVLYLVFALSHPFSGSAMISPHPFDEVEMRKHVH